MFMGTYYNSIDAKNRMIVPAKLRSQLKGDECVITMGMEKNLCIYSMEDWEILCAKFKKIPESDLKARSFVRKVTGSAAYYEFDSQGRIIIPDNLREHAGIQKELVTMGVIDKIEVWAKEVWTSSEYSGEIDAEEWAKALLQYGF